VRQRHDDSDNSLDSEFPIDRLLLNEPSFAAVARAPAGGCVRVESSLETAWVQLVKHKYHRLLCFQFHTWAIYSLFSLTVLPVLLT
jgi:hypothetical protein